MLIKELFKKEKTLLSFEFFPPKSEKAANNLVEATKKLKTLQPDYVSVTYGAGGSTRERTHQLVSEIQNEANLPVVAHLTCVNHTKNEIREILKKYNDDGIHNILALRGDLPKDSTVNDCSEFGYASELVAFIKKEFPNMCVGVAGFPEGHPECQNRLQEIEYLKEKIDSGADYICTQLFFNNEDFYDFSERCEIAGINVPIVAGIMPITSMSNMKRMASLALGARFPAKLMKAVNRAGDDEGVENVGLHWASKQVFDLLDNNVSGIHFYTLNQSKATIRICEQIGIRNSDQL